MFTRRTKDQLQFRLKQNQFRILMQKSKLKVGLLLDSLELNAWTYRMIEIIRNSD